VGVLYLSDFFPSKLYAAGFTDLISVIPPGAALTPTSTISSAMVGKVPGRKLPSGLWAGYDWRKAVATEDDVATWQLQGANVGLRSDSFPAVDIDILDESLAKIVEDFATATLGPAPIRYGRRPKKLLVYKTDEPFGKMKLTITKHETTHLVEILGKGQQFLVYGVHPTTLRPYEWDGELQLPTLTTITREQASHFLDELAALLDMLGAGVVERSGDGALATRALGTEQTSLMAPSIEDLRACVALIPNDGDTRDEYINMGIAIRAAAGEAAADDGFAIFASWAGRYAKDGRVGGNPDTWLGDWRRFRAPFALGWDFIAALGRQHGFNSAATDFEVTEEAPRVSDLPVEAPAYSDQWLADCVVRARCNQLRYIPVSGKWIVWDGARWQPDAELLAEDIVNQELRVIAANLLRQGSTDKERREAQSTAISICSAGKATSVRGVMQSNRAVAVSMDSLDHNQWVINTPTALIDLRTGLALPSDPDALCTKTTSVPAVVGPHPEWDRFLGEATGNDSALIEYLQTMCGYALTGSTREQNLTFIWGKGGNGKGTFLNVLIGILADYCKSASMDTFTASTTEKHTTDIAMLTGARLVTASETQAGKRWDEQKVKALTGGDPITARFMRQDNFTYKPQFKLVFIGNHKPEIRDIDDAMRRRIQMVPFTVKPALVDNQLEEKLKSEWPAILAWMVDGCLKWQKTGLVLPAAVQALTTDYFSTEDALGRWLSECCTLGPGASTAADLFASWREWASTNGEYPGSLKRLSSALLARGLEKWREPTTRRQGFLNITINRQDFEPIN
jgi:putative DNA primase/helicase